MKFWDTRTPTPAAVVNLSERAYSMDTKGAMMVVATADKKVRLCRNHCRVFVALRLLDDIPLTRLDARCTSWSSAGMPTRGVDREFMSPRSFRML